MSGTFNQKISLEIQGIENIKRELEGLFAKLKSLNKDFKGLDLNAFEQSQKFTLSTPQIAAAGSGKTPLQVAQLLQSSPEKAQEIFSQAMVRIFTRLSQDPRLTEAIKRFSEDLAIKQASSLRQARNRLLIERGGAPVVPSGLPRPFPEPGRLAMEAKLKVGEGLTREERLRAKAQDIIASVRQATSPRAIRSAFAQQAAQKRAAEQERLNRELLKIHDEVEKKRLQLAKNEKQLRSKIVSIDDKYVTELHKIKQLANQQGNLAQRLKATEEALTLAEQTLLKQRQDTKRFFSQKQLAKFRSDWLSFRKKVIAAQGLSKTQQERLLASFKASAGIEERILELERRKRKLKAHEIMLQRKQVEAQEQYVKQLGRAVRFFSRFAVTPPGFKPPGGVPGVPGVSGPVFPSLGAIIQNNLRGTRTGRFAQNLLRIGDKRRNKAPLHLRALGWTFMAQILEQYVQSIVETGGQALTTEALFKKATGKEGAKQLQLINKSSLGDFLSLQEKQSLLSKVAASNLPISVKELVPVLSKFAGIGRASQFTAAESSQRFLKAILEGSKEPIDQLLPGVNFRERIAQMEKLRGRPFTQQERVRARFDILKEAVNKAPDLSKFTGAAAEVEKIRTQFRDIRDEIAKAVLKSQEFRDALKDVITFVKENKDIIVNVLKNVLTVIVSIVSHLKMIIQLWSAFKGAQLGATVGSLFGPTGTVVGGVLGAAAAYFSVDLASSYLTSGGNPYTAPAYNAVPQSSGGSQTLAAMANLGKKIQSATQIPSGMAVFTN